VAFGRLNMVQEITAYQDDSGKIHRRKSDAAVSNLITDLFKARDTMSDGQSIPLTELEKLARTFAIDTNSAGRRMFREAIERFERERA
jgi:hypothetical protein